MTDYKEVVDLISPTADEVSRVNRTRDSLVKAIDESFIDDNNYSHATIIGSAATGNFLRGYRDLDSLLLFHEYDSEGFRKRVSGIKGLKEIEFTGKKLTVEDKANARYNHFEVSLGAVLLNATPERSLGLDMEKHPSFTESMLSSAQNRDVLLTKQFFKNIGLYGAKIGGFTVEQIISQFGEFEEVLKRLRDGGEINIDYSGNFTGNDSPIIVTYPFCGLDNLAKRVSKEDIEKSRTYAQLVLSDPEQFLEDSRRTMNKDFWVKRAIKYKDLEEFGFPDIYLNHRENRILRRKIDPYKRIKVLDVGCANGYSTIAIARPGNNHFFGIDANNEAIEMANRLKDQNGLEDITFNVGEMTDVPFEDNFFDVVYAKRALSNLPSRKEQKKAIEGLSRLTKIDGRLYVFDLFIEGYERLNQIRNSFGLEKIEFPFHCIPLTEDFIAIALENGLKIYDEEDLTSSYYLMSRVVYPRLLKSLGLQANANSIPNWLFSKFPSFGNIGANKLYTFTKKMIRGKKVQQYIESIDPIKLGLREDIGKPTIVRTYSGESNKIYFVNYGSFPFVLKINGIKGKDTDFFKKEYDKLRSLQEFGIAPKAFVYDESSLGSQSMILEMVRGETLKGKRVGNHLEQVLDSLNEMVEIPAEILREREGFRRNINNCWDYVHMFPLHAKRQLEEYFDRIGHNSIYELCRQASENVERKIDSQKGIFNDSKIGLIHTGLHPENIVYTPDRQIRFIDWEHSSVGDRAFEISSLIRSNNFSEEEVEKIFYRYKGQTGDFLPRVDLYAELFKVHEVLWHALRYDKAKKGELDLSEERNADYYKKLLEWHIENLKNSDLI